MKLIVRMSAQPLDYFGGDLTKFAEFISFTDELASASGMSSPSITWRAPTKEIALGYWLPNLQGLAWELKQLLDEAKPHSLVTDELLKQIVAIYRKYYPKTEGLYERSTVADAPIPWSLAHELIPCLGQFIDLDTEGIVPNESERIAPPTEAAG